MRLNDLEFPDSIRRQGLLRKAFIALALLLVIEAGVSLIAGLTVPSSCDGFYRWQESSYMLRGYDPFLVASGRLAPLDAIGALNTDGGNMPWTYLLSNCIYPGFLPYAQALLVARIVFVALFALTTFRITVYVRGRYAPTRFETMFLLGVLFASYMWFATLRLGNHAAYITLMVFLLLTFDHNEHWVAAGILYAFLLMKPQDSGLFLLLFFLRKQWKPILLCGGILLGSTLVTSAIIGCAPWTMLLNAYELCVSYQNLDNYIYYGLLDPLVSVFHIDSSIILPIGMGLGIAAVAFAALKCKHCDKERLLAFTAVVSMSWMYVQPSDIILLGLVGFACATALLYQYGGGRMTLPLLVGALLMAIPIPGIVYMSGPIVPLIMRLLLIGVTVILLIADERGLFRLRTNVKDAEEKHASSAEERSTHLQGVL